MAFGKKNGDTGPEKTTGTDVEVAQNHLPADFNLSEQIKKDLEAISDQTQGSSVERIRMSGRGFTTPDGETGATIRGIIVDFATAYNHYPDAYDPDNPSPPNCFATGKNINQLAPDPASPEPQAELCSKCPKNEFESGVGKSKACKNTRIIALMQEGAVEESPIWVMSVPPSSMKFFDTYVSSTLRGRHGLTPICVITEMYMDDKFDYAAPRFKMERKLTDEELSFFFGRKAEAESLLLQKPVIVGS